MQVLERPEGWGQQGLCREGHAEQWQEGGRSERNGRKEKLAILAGSPTGAPQGSRGRRGACAVLRRRLHRLPLEDCQMRQNKIAPFNSCITFFGWVFGFPQPVQREQACTQRQEQGLPLLLDRFLLFCSCPLRCYILLKGAVGIWVGRQDELNEEEARA